MKISFHWLNEFIDLKAHAPEEIANTLTMKTCEVESVDTVFDFPKEIVVGELKEIAEHPNADKLKICKVQINKAEENQKELSIVTGAKNIYAGKKYPLAVEGAHLSNGVLIRRSKLRGVESEGMLCSAEELGMQDFIFPHLENPEGEISGLLELPAEAPVGKPISDVFSLKDVIFDIDNKSITHRPDLWGVFGFARELSAILGLPIKTNPNEAQPNIPVLNLSGSEGVQVRIKNNSAAAYSCSVMTNVKIKPSEMKVQARLVTAGMRPINNIVDASNYVMLELGQPNHAFDRNQIKGDIEISFSRKNEEMTTLDLEKRILPEGVVLVRDGGRPVAIGGIIGGENTQVAHQTSSIFLESASFHRRHIRKAVSALALRTEASQRFEKGLDPSLTEAAIRRFAEILGRSCQDLKMSPIQTTRQEEIKKNQIQTTFSYISDRLGEVNVSPDEIKSVLTALNMKCESNGDHLSVEVPSYRSYYDIEIKEDIVEEVARMMGYQKIREKPLSLPCEVPSHPNRIRRLEHELRYLFSYSYHFMEVYNGSFHSAGEIESDTRYASHPVELKNPIQQDQKYLRVSPLPGLLKNIAENHKQNTELRFYEIERIFLPRSENSDELPDEKGFLAGLLTSSEEAPKVLAFMGSFLGDALGRLGVPRERLKYQTSQGDIFHPGRCGEIRLKKTPRKNTQNAGKPLFQWGEVHPALTQKHQIARRVFYFESFLDELSKVSSDESTYQPIPRFPSSVFEVTVLADRLTPFEKIERAITSPPKQSFQNGVHERIDFIGSFSGESIPDSKKAVSLKLTWINHQKTIEHDEVKSLQKHTEEKLRQAGFPLKR